MAKFQNIDEIKQANAASSQPHWFSPDTMRFFSTRIGRTVYGGRFFITSEQRDYSSPRLYTIREAKPDGTIDTVGEFQGYATRAAATRQAQRLAETMMSAAQLSQLVNAFFGAEWDALDISQRVAVRRDVAEMLAATDKTIAERMAEYRRDLTPPDNFPGYLARYADTLALRW